jgi:hypothetical protein
MADGNVQGSLVLVQANEQEALSSFLAKLTELSRQTGIAINGAPELYVMEPEDHAFTYQSDAQSRLHLA